MSALSIRAAQPRDEALVYAVLYGLADYEKLLYRFFVTRETITRDYFCDNPLIHCALAFEGERHVGGATWFWTYAGFAAKRGLYIEDLFVSPEFRGRGYGKALMKHLVNIAAEADALRVDWAVLDWNQPSIDFYVGIGAQLVTGLPIYRLDREAMKKLAQ